MAQPGAAAPALVAMNQAQLAALAQLMRGGATKLRRMTEATPAAWLEHRRHFAQIVDLQNWEDLRQRQELMASVQEKAGNAVMDLQVANFATIDLLIEAMAARFLPAAAGATARSNYQNARQLPTETAREWHTRVRELFYLAYPAAVPNDQAHCLDLFVNGLVNANVRFFVASQNLADFTAALPVAERAETANRDVAGSGRQGNAGVHQLGGHQHAPSVLAMGGQQPSRGPLACYFCADMFRIQAPHTKNRCPYWKAARDAYNAGAPPGAQANQAGQQHSGRQANQRGGRGGGRGRGSNRRQGGQTVNAVGQDSPSQPPPPRQFAYAADSSDEAEN